MSTTIYTITCPKFAGAVKIIFADGYCQSYNSSEAVLTDKQKLYFTDKLSLTEEAFLNTLGQAGIFTIVGEKEALTFDMFWNKYNEKAHSSKKKTQAKWQRMSKEQQIKAYMHIPAYFKNIPNGIAKKYAETYLNSEIWNN